MEDQHITAYRDLRDFLVHNYKMLYGTEAWHKLLRESNTGLYACKKAIMHLARDNFKISDKA